MRALLLIAAASLLATPLPAQTPAPPAPQADAAGNDIIVEGQSRKSVQSQVRSMTQDVSETGQIARWNDPICVNVANLDQPYAGMVIDRIYSVAEQLKIQTGKPNCKPNILIVMTSDADGAAKQIAKKGISDKDAKELLKPRAVRWLDASETRTAEGRAIAGFDAGGIPINRTTAPASRIRAATREAAILSLVIVDFKRLDHVSWPQLSDYLAMVTLGRPHFGSDYSGSTILALFKDRDEGSTLPSGLTRQDQGFLVGLYNSYDLQGGFSQRAAIAAQTRKGAQLDEQHP